MRLNYISKEISVEVCKHLVKEVVKNKDETYSIHCINCKTNLRKWSPQ